MLSGHKQPELAETFFNSVCCNILHRTYFHNDFIFVRPVVSTEYIETEELLPTYRVYYPATDGLRFALKRIVTNFQLDCTFADLDRDIAQVEARLIAESSAARRWSRTTRSRCCPTCSSGTRAPTSSARCINGTREYPVRGADPAQPPRRAGARHGAARPRADHDPVLVHARLFPGRHGSAVGLRAVPAHACCRASRAARSTPSSACKSRARRCSTAITCST